MTIEEKVQQLLLAASGVTGAVADRIKPRGDWQNLNRPYIVHFPVSTNPTYTHEARAQLTEWNYQVSCYADSYSTARSLSQAVVSALSGQHGGVTMFWQDQAAQFEPNPPVHHIALDFQAFEGL